MSLSQSNSPPLYDEIDCISRPEQRIDLRTFLLENPVPREAEALQVTGPPEYSCTVLHFGTLLKKVENTTDEFGSVRNARRRNWTTVFAVLRGTKLEMHRGDAGNDVEANLSHEKAACHTRSTPRLSSRSSTTTSQSSSSPTCSRQPRPMREYSMCGAVAGVASDYVKRENVLRIRADNQQFLIQCKGSQDAIEWLETIQKAVNISEPLESREEPRFVTSVRRRRVSYPGKSLPYEVFEAVNAQAPLRQRARCASSCTSQTRRTAPQRSASVHAAPEDVHLRRALSNLFRSPSLTTDLVRTTVSSTRNGGQGTGEQGGRICEKLALLEKGSCVSPGSKRKKAERYIFPTLPTSHPWQVTDLQRALAC